MLGKLQITSTQDTEKLHTVARLAQEAIDEKVADDAATRNALSKLSASISKLQAAPERSRAASRNASRAPSVAPSAMDDGETVVRDEASRDSEGSGTVRDDAEAVAPETPAPSPHKKGRSKAPGSPRRRTTRQLTPLEEAASDGVVAEAAEVGDLTLAEEAAVKEGMARRQPSQRASRPRWKPDELLQDDQGGAQLLESSRDGEPVNNMTTDAPETVTAAPPKRRGRAARSALDPADSNAVPTAPARAGRKSVRASRRQQQTASTTAADADESLLD